jgi:O-antigen/teichoic acid export membrane protein
VVLSAATSVLLARYLGRERMGEYGAIYAYLALYSWLATFGLDQILAREASQRRGEAGSILLTGTAVALCFSAAGITLSFLLGPSFGYGGGMRTLVLFAAVDSLLIPAASLVGTIFQVDMRQWYAVGLGLLRQVLWLLAVALLAFGKAEFFSVIMARTLVGLATAAVTLLVCWRRRLLPGPWCFSGVEARKLLRFGFPIAFGAVAVGLFQRIDQVMLHKMSGNLVLGPYVVAVILTEQISAFPTALLSSLFPVLSRVADQEELFRHYLGLSYRLLMTVAFFFCAVVIPVTVPFVELFYGKEFHSSAALINVLIWSEAPLFLAVVLTNALVAKNLQRYLPITPIIAAAANISLNLLLIPKWGALGASWATVVSYSSALVFLLFKPTRFITWQGLSIAAPPLALALAISFTMQHWAVHFVVKFIVAVLLYAGGVRLIGTVRATDLQRFKEIARRTLDRSRPTPN